MRSASAQIEIVAKHKDAPAPGDYDSADVWAFDGVEGIVQVLRCILAEADLLMAVDGYPRIADLEPSSLMAVG